MNDCGEMHVSISCKTIAVSVIDNERKSRFFICKLLKNIGFENGVVNIINAAIKKAKEKDIKKLIVYMKGNNDRNYVKALKTIRESDIEIVEVRED